MSKKTFVGGAALLGIAGLITKAIGALYRIPLTNIIGEQGMGIYQTVYPVYALLLTVSTTGIPTAISKMVSAYYARGDYRGAHRVYKTALVLMIFIGAVLAAAMYFASGWLAYAMEDPEAAIAFQTISPAVFFVAVLCAFRGYYQGQQIMMPTASSQLMEQAGKLAMGLFLAAAWLPMGVQWGAAGTLLGVSFSELAALLLLVGIYVFTMRSRRELMRQSIRVPYSQRPRFKELSWKLAVIAVPVTIGGAIMPIIGFIDAAIIKGALLDIGYTLESARSLFGILTGVVNPLVAMPTVLSSALQMSLVPVISHAKERRDKKSIRVSALIGTKLAIYIALPCAVGLFVLSEPIIRCLFSGLQSQNIPVSVQLLQQMAAGVLFLSLVQTLTGVLQGMGKVMVPVFNLLVGAIFKVILSIILIRIPSINISGAVVGTIVCYVVASGLNLWQVYRRTRMPFRIMDCVVKPVIASVVMGAFAYFFNLWLLPLAGKWIALAAGVGGGGLAYILLILVLGGISHEELDMIPGGKRLKRFVRRKDSDHRRER